MYVVNVRTVRPHLTQSIGLKSHFANGSLHCGMHYGYGETIMRLGERRLP